MPYSADTFTKAPLKSLSPNLVNNNLAVGRDRLAYVHSKGASTVTHGGREAEVTNSKIETKNIAYSLSIQACYSLSGCAIVLTNQVGLQIWNNTGQLMYFNYEHPGVLPTVEGTIMWHVSCAAGIQPADEGLALVVAATSDGQFLNFGIDHSSGQAKHLATCKSGQSCITALGSEVDSCRGAAKSALLVSGDDKGGLKLWSVDEANQMTEKCSKPDGKHGPVVSLVLRNGKVVAAYSDGVVEVLAQSDLKPEVEFYAHSRILTAMDIHPTKDIIATVSEDSTLNVFPIPTRETPEATPLLSVCWPMVMLTGVAFCGRTSDDIATVGYDHDEMRIFTGP
mmetsp:Transcript_13544/g.38522  ORF Transcript_13544/g.38522 Transcript_13544/m.38522 type:complete len:338 (+) Transcript_13544:277-1290(+)